MNNDPIIILEMCVAGRGTLLAGAIITPGCLVERNVNGDLIPHQFAGGPAQRMLALSSSQPYKNYSIGETVTYKVCRSGDQMYGFLADGENVIIGDYLCSAGNGVFKKVSSQDVALSLALEPCISEGDTKLKIEML